jgi:hypothetical protein
MCCEITTIPRRQSGRAQILATSPESHCSSSLWRGFGFWPANSENKRRVEWGPNEIRGACCGLLTARFPDEILERILLRSGLLFTPKGRTLRHHP